MTRKRSKNHPRSPFFARRGKQAASFSFARGGPGRGDPLRSGRMPRTLVDGSTGANAATGIRAIAASIHFRRPCYAAQLQRIGRALAEGVTEAGAAAAWTEKPVPLGAVADNTVAEGSLSDHSAAENALSELDWTTLGDPIL